MDKRRNTTEALLQASDEWIRLFLHHAPAAIAMLDRDLRYLLVSERYKKAHGLAGDLVGRSLYELSPEMPERWKEAHRRALTGEVLQVDADPVLRQGRTQYVKWEVRPWLLPSGDIGGILIAMEDVTTGIQAAATLGESEAQFRTLADAIPQLAWMAEADGWIYWYNRRWYDYTGTTPEQMEGWGWQRVHDPETLPAVLERWKGSIATGEPFDMVSPLRGVDGTYRLFLTRVQPLKTEDGQVVQWFGTNTDVDDLKRAEKALSESEERLRLATKAAAVGLWEWNVLTNDVRWDAQMFTIYGVERTPDGVVPYSTWSHAVLTEDLSQQEAILRETLRRKGSSARAFRIRRASDGSVRHIEAVETVRMNNQGEAEWLVGTNIDVTERKWAEEEMQRLGAIVMSSTDAIVGVTLQGVVTTWNRGAERLYGYRADEMIGQPIDTIIPSNHQEEETCILSQISSGKTVNHYETVRRRKDGSLVPVSLTMSPVKDGDRIVGASKIARDITVQKQAEEQLRESEDRFRQLSSSLPLLAWTCREDGLCDFLSQQWVDYTGIPASASLGHAWLNQLHPDDREETIQAWNEAVRTDSNFKSEFRIRRHDGSYRWFDTRAVRVRDAEGRTLKWFGFNADITERRQAEEALRQLKTGLEQRVKERTQELENSEQQLRALAAALNLTEQRERKRLAAELHDHLQQLLVFGRLQLGQGKRLAAPAPACADVMEKVDEALSEALTYTRTLVAELSPSALREHGLAAGLKWLAEYMKKRDFEVTVQVPHTMECELPEDPSVLLFQSVRELLINSAKHAGTGQATVTLEQPDGRLDICVSDEGAGFDLAAAQTPHGGFAGKFGLFSIRERMRALGGSFTIQSAPGKGTTATLTLPLGRPWEGNSEEKQLKTDSRQPVNRSSLPADDSPVSTHQPIRVLLVDDHQMVRQGLRSVLEDYPDVQLVGEAGDGEEAVMLADRLRPHVVVMDINMPKLNGIEATASIKARHGDTLVIGLSVNAEGENQHRMLQAGARTLLTKEAAVEQLYHCIVESVKAAP